MQVIYGLKRLKKFRRPVVALGVFDGVHRGHARILKSAVRIARRIKGTSIALTFYPHPQKQESLYSLQHRLRLIGELGLDACIVVDFNKAFSQITAADFVRDILAGKIAAAYICVGKNFRFGRGAAGDSRLLGKLGSACGFKLKAFDVIKKDGRAISSTYIRRLISEGRLKSAQGLLSRPVSVLGEVIKGVSLARRLGFPTANINPHHEVLPPAGVYAVEIIFGRERFKGLCYIGTRPTFGARKKKQVEVYIFDFKKDIYGKYLEIRFINKIRGERRFADTGALISQIKKDIARALLLARSSPSRHRSTHNIS